MGGASLTTGLEQYLRKILNIPVQILDQTTAVDVIGAGMMLQDAKLLKLCSKLWYNEFQSAMADITKVEIHYGT